MKKWFVVVCCLFLALSSAWAQNLTITFDNNTKTDPAYASESFTSDGVTFNSLRCIGGNAGASGDEGDKCIRLQHAGKGEEITNACFATASALGGPISRISFDYKAASATHTNRQWALEVSKDGVNWTPVTTVTTAESWATADTDNPGEGGLPGGNTYFRIISANTGTTQRMADFDNVKVWYDEGIIVTFDRTNWFEVVEGTAGETVTATADNGVPPYTYVWNCDQSGEITDVAGDTLTIPDTLTEGDYTLCVTVTDSDDGELGPQGGNFLIGLRVVKPVVKYPVTVVNGIYANGTISVSPTEAAVDTEVTIIPAPDPGFVLESLSATWAEGDLEIVGGKFTMPAGEVTVTATFAEYTGGDLTITFDEESATSTKSTSTSFISGGITFNAVECIGKQTGQSGNEDDYAMRVRHVNGTKGCFATATALSLPIEKIKFAYKAGSATSTHLNKEWSLETSIDGVIWTNLVTVAAGEDWATEEVSEGIPANSKFFRIISASTNVSSTARNADFDNIEIWYGEASYHLELTGVENGARVPYDEDNPAVTLTAEAKDGGQDPFTYEWTINGGVVDGYTAETYSFAELGAYEVSVTCTDANGVTTEPVGVIFTIEQQFAVHPPVGVTGGTITGSPNPAFVGDTVTISADPAEGYVLDGELTAVWGEENIPLEISKGNTFEMPAGDVHLGGKFRIVEDTAALPFEWHGPWRENLAALDGVTGALGADGSDKNYENQGNGVANFGAKSHNFCVKFDSAPATVSYWIHGTAYETNAYTFQVQESADGETWSDVAVYTSTDEGIDGYAQVTNELKEASRYVKFSFLERSAGSVGIDGIVISGEGGDQPEASIVFIGETTATVGGTITLSFALENYEGACTWALEPAEGCGEIDSATGVYTWTPSEAGTATITVSALDGTLSPIATSGEILLTVEDAPGPGPEPILVEATLTGPVTIADGKAVFEVSLDNPAAELAADDIWAADDIADASSWKPAEGAEVIPANGGYKVSVPEAAGNFIAVGKPSFLATE